MCRRRSPACWRAWDTTRATPRLKRRRQSRWHAGQIEPCCLYDLERRGPPIWEATPLSFALWARSASTREQHVQDELLLVGLGAPTRYEREIHHAPLRTPPLRSAALTCARYGHYIEPAKP